MGMYAGMYRWHVVCTAVQASSINVKEKSMLMHPTKSGIRGIFLGLVSAIFLMNPFTVQAVEKENKPPVSRSKTTPADTAQTQLNQLDERMLEQLAQI
jgi:hypothetical protein